MTEYRFTIYIYIDGSYGTTGISFSDRKIAIEKCMELTRLNNMSYGIFLEYFDDGIHHRRLSWKDGEDVVRKYNNKISYTAQLLLKFIQGFVRDKRRIPTFDEIKSDLVKRDYDIYRLLQILDKNNYIELSKPFLKSHPFKIRKQ